MVPRYSFDEIQGIEGENFDVRLNYDQDEIRVLKKSKVGDKFIYNAFYSKKSLYPDDLFKELDNRNELKLIDVFFR